MSNEQPVENLMRSTMENLRDMIDANTVIGEPIETKDGTCIIPVSKLSFGFISGGSELRHPVEDSKINSYPFGGGSGSGVSLRPITFLIIKDDVIRMMPVEYDSTYDRLVDSVPQVLDMIKNLIKDISGHKHPHSHEDSCAPKENYDCTDDNVH
ncbi:GerW family sporulation protein [uncultured Clostridium sp.]|uniref:GerW family sporulation protein n=1 Tax=uncultured Clostridium sp. TaxID=59620 RepID=UPI0025F86A41|nr:GerW family sporulation protein [uncultured Clostridium sp.]